MKFDKHSFEQAQNAHLANAREIFSRLQNPESELSDHEVMSLFNDMSFYLSDVFSVSSLVAAVHPDEDVRCAAEAFEVEANKLSTEISLSRFLFESFARIDISKLDEETTQYVLKILEDFHRSGVDKDEETRAKVQSLNEELVELRQSFGKNIRDDVRYIEIAKEKLTGLPQDYIDAHPVDAKTGKVKITTSYPDVNPFLRYANDTESRQKIYYEFFNRAAPENRDLLKTLLQKRFELAHLLGYNSWADYVTQDKMTKNSKMVEKFLGTLEKMSTDIAKSEYQELLEMKRRLFGEATDVYEWERAYIGEKLRSEKFGFDSQELRPYFEYNRVKNGLFDITQKLYGITYQKIEVEVWHKSVDVYEVYDGETLLGRIYLDMHPRENKFNHAAQFALKTGLLGRQLPEAVLVCNFTDPEKAKDNIALLSYDEVNTFFHEFGHLLHFIFAGHHKWSRQSGLTMEWDFVEAPSQLFEEWVHDYDVLTTFAKHFETGETIPKDLVEKLCASQKFGNGLFLRQQILYASLSLLYHTQDPFTLDTHELFKQLHLRYSFFPYAEGTNFELSFGHLEDYTAMYYTYMWSLSISKDLLTLFKSKGLLSSEIATQYRKNILERGGTCDAATQIRDFLGREYTVDAFKNWLEGKD